MGGCVISSFEPQTQPRLDFNLDITPCSQISPEQLASTASDVINPVVTVLLQVGKLSLSTVPAHLRLRIVSHDGESASTTNTRPEPSSRPSSSYHVKGAVNQVYSEILLSRVCMPYIHNGTSSQHWQRLTELLAGVNKVYVLEVCVVCPAIGCI